jgi:arylformamidase
LLGNDILVVEAINLENVQAGYYELLCFPLCISELDGCPVRCVLRNIG